MSHSDDGLIIEQNLLTHSTKITFWNDNPLQINLIVRCIFRYLNLSNLKECRKVSSMWNEEAEPFITNLSKVIFSSHSSDGEAILRTPKKFCQEFPESRIASKFNSFSILGGSYPISEINKFFEAQKHYIKELQFAEINLTSDFGRKLEAYDISDWIKDSPITKFRIQKSRNSIVAARSLSQLIIPLRHLSSIQHLELQGHKLEIGNGFQISPRKLEFSNVTISRNAEDLKQCRINEFMKFNGDTEINLRFFNPTNLIVDFGENFIAKKINLRRETKVINWGISRCTVHTLVMHGIPVLEKTEMKVKHLKLSTSSLDLTGLPKELETLRLFVTINRPGAIFCSEPLFLPNLRFVMIDALHSAALSHFENCPNLIEVYIHCVGGHVSLNLSCIPKTVKTLKIHDINLIIERTCTVETLLIYQSTLKDAERILTQIKTKVLVLHLADTDRHKFEEELVQFLPHSEDITIYVGPIPSFRTLNLSEYVDTESEFYIFRQGKGNSINQREFYDIIFPKRY